MQKSGTGAVIGCVCVAAGLAAFGVLLAAPSFIGYGAAHVTSLSLAGGVFTIALAAALRD